MKRVFALCALLLAAVAFADESRPARLDFTSTPEGANVLVDGNLRGVTPLTLYDVAPGQVHRLRFELKNYEPFDEFVAVDNGAYLSRHAELVPVKGLLLLTSEPSGCSITLDGVSLGETPRLVTTLDAKGSYRLLLQKPGYQQREVEVGEKRRVLGAQPRVLALEPLHFRLELAYVRDARSEDYVLGVHFP